MREIVLNVSDYPPAKNEAKSMLAAGHSHSERVLALLRAARDAIGGKPQPIFPSESLGLDVVLEAATEPPADATNYLGGVADVLEEKSHRGALDHLSELASVAVYANDRQIHEVHFRWRPGPTARYKVRIWAR